MCAKPLLREGRFIQAKKFCHTTVMKLVNTWTHSLTMYDSSNCLELAHNTTHFV